MLLAHALLEPPQKNDTARCWYISVSVSVSLFLFRIDFLAQVCCGGVWTLGATGDRCDDGIERVVLTSLLTQYPICQRRAVVAQDATFVRKSENFPLCSSADVIVFVFLLAQFVCVRAALLRAASTRSRRTSIVNVCSFVRSFMTCRFRSASALRTVAHDNGTNLSIAIDWFGLH